MRVVPPTPQGLAEAADALRKDNVVAYPTDTFYGLAVNPFSARAVTRLFEVKSRAAQNAVILVVADADQVYEIANALSDRAWTCIQHFWPGPLSLALPRSPKLPETVTAGRDTVCVRCPNSRVARDLCRAFGGAITSTSANRSGHEPARSVDEIELKDIAVAVDGGALPPSLPSTVYDPDRDVILRPGAVSQEMLHEVVPPLVDKRTNQ
jgi:L-threonylcarbamoyladenylate synthase